LATKPIPHPREVQVRAQLEPYLQPHPYTIPPQPPLRQNLAKMPIYYWINNFWLNHCRGTGVMVVPPFWKFRTSFATSSTTKI